MNRRSSLRQRARAATGVRVAATLASAIEVASVARASGRPAGSALSPVAAFARPDRRSVCVAPGRIAVSLGQPVVGGDVLGVDGERAAVGGDRLLEDNRGAIGLVDRQLDACPGVERWRQLVDHP